MHWLRASKLSEEMQKDRCVFSVLFKRMCRNSERKISALFFIIFEVLNFTKYVVGAAGTSPQITLHASDSVLSIKSEVKSAHRIFHCVLQLK